MEPPLEVGGDDLVHGGHVAGAQGVIEGENHPLITRKITFFQIFLRVSQL
jgi:hypothetical protein